MNQTFRIEAKVQKQDKSLVNIIKACGIEYPHESLAFFSSVYAKFEEANKNGVELANSVKAQVPQLRGTQVNINHLRKNWIVGTILDAWVVNDEIKIAFSFYKSVYPDLYENALELLDNNELTVSFELKVAKADIEAKSNGIKRLLKVSFDGVGLLLGEKPACPEAIVYEQADINKLMEQDLVFANKIKNINKKEEESTVDDKANNALLAKQKEFVIAEFGEDAVKDWTDEDFVNEEKIEELKKAKDSTSKEEQKDEGKESEFAEEDKELEEGAKWTTKFINSLPNSSFAVIEPAYLEGKTDNKNARHLPFKDASGKVDLPHLRNALARVNQIKPVTDSITAEELQKKALAKLNKYRKMLKTASEELEAVQKEIETEEAQVVNEKTTTTVVYDVTRNDETGTMEVIETTTTQVEKDGKMIKDEKVVRNTVYSSEKVDALKADYEAKLSEKDNEITVLKSKISETENKEKSEKIKAIRDELGEYVKDYSDDDLFDAVKIENARLRKERDELKSGKKTVVASEEENEDLETGHEEQPVENKEENLNKYIKTRYKQ